MICACGRDASDRLATVLIVVARNLDDGADPATIGAILEVTSRAVGAKGCSHGIHAAAVLNHLAVTLELGSPAAGVAAIARRRARAIRSALRPPLTSAEVEETAALLNASDASPWAVLGIRADGGS